MKIQLTDVSNRFGAPMGRNNQEVSGKCYLQRLPLLLGVYDRGGAYWGYPANLWVCQDQEGHQFFVRSGNRQQAKFAIIHYNKNITFYR